MNEKDCKDEQAVKKHLTVLLPKDHPVVRALEAVEFVWGSCQYDSDAEQYANLCKYEAEHSKDEVLAKFDIKVGSLRTFTGEVLTKFKETLFEQLAEWEADGEDMTELRTELEDVKTVVDALRFLRNWSWDLWSAAPYIAASVFPGLLKDGKPVTALDGQTGLICWLLKSHNFVADDEPFKEWDT